MPATTLDRLAAASLDDRERAVLERFVALLERELPVDMKAVWLFGSRARGEKIVDPESDVDLLVVTGNGRPRDSQRVFELLWVAANESNANPLTFSVHIVDPGWAARRRAVNSFFIQDVDRDKIVLAGEP
jgi:predicted nucleotidyltransferase